MRPPSAIFVIVFLEGGVVLYDIVRCVHECMPGHPGASGAVIARLIDRRIQTGEGEQLIGAGEVVYVTDFPKCHSAVDVADARNGHDDRVMELQDFCQMGLRTVPLAIQ